MNLMNYKNIAFNEIFGNYIINKKKKEKIIPYSWGRYGFFEDKQIFKTEIIPEKISYACIKKSVFLKTYIISEFYFDDFSKKFTQLQL